MTHQPSKMLIEAGIIPKNTLQQLTNWRLLPEGYAESHGVRPVKLDTSDAAELERFVKDLSVAITKDMAEIRETELDRSGCYRKAQLKFKDSRLDTDEGEVFVDRLGRLVTPNSAPWPSLETVQFEQDTSARHVVKSEPRYEGDKSVALVIYLEAKEGDVHA